MKSSAFYILLFASLALGAQEIDMAPLVSVFLQPEGSIRLWPIPANDFVVLELVGIPGASEKDAGKIIPSKVTANETSAPVLFGHDAGIQGRYTSNGVHTLKYICMLIRFLPDQPDLITRLGFT
jgi:hypothetical protein